MPDLGISTVVTVLAFVVLLLLLRPVYLWYWGVKDIISNQRKTNELLEKLIGDTKNLEEKVSTSSSEGTKFRVGELVIIKATENQFRIGGIDYVTGTPHYYKDEHSEKYAEQDIENFDSYWKQKKA